jgi:hypothetical protein
MAQTARTNKTTAVDVSEIVARRIAQIPPEELASTKVASILDKLKKGGVRANAKVRKIVSDQLEEAQRAAVERGPTLATDTVVPADVQTVSDMIRQEIERIPRAELEVAKPARILENLEAAGVDITGSVRSMTSRHLKAAKAEAVARPRPQLASSTVVSGDRLASAAALIEACGSIEAAKQTLDLLEKISQKR